MKNSLNMGFCEIFSYPWQVKRHFVRIAQELDSRKVLSVILHGSVARGELTWWNRKNEMMLFSDYEFQIISKGKLDKGYYKKLIKAYKELEDEVSLNSPLFHIDFSYVNLRQLRKLPRSFLTFSKKSYGWILWGQDVRHVIPDITLENLDWSEHNKAFIWRLFALLIHLTPEMICGKEPPTSKVEISGYAIAKNSLDLTTWGVPYEGHLLSTYRERVNFIKTNYSSLELARFMGSGFPAFLERCLSIKKDPSQVKSPLELYTKAIPYFSKAMKYLRHKMRIEIASFPSNAVDSHDFDFYSHFSNKQKGWEFIKLFSNPYKSGVSFRRGCQWFLEPKFRLILASLATIHSAILLRIEENTGESAEKLDAARRLINRLSLNTCDATRRNSFEEEFFFLRDKLVKAMEDVIPGLVHQREYIRRSLK